MSHDDYSPPSRSDKLVAGAIIREAVDDWRYWKGITQRSHHLPSHRILGWTYAKRLGYATPRDELLGFFQDAWFEELCDIVGESVCPYAIRRELEIPDDRPARIEKQASMELTSANWGQVDHNWP